MYVHLAFYSALESTKLESPMSVKAPSVGTGCRVHNPQTELRLLRADVCTAAACLRRLFYTKKINKQTTMEGGFCNIQVLLRAAEFLERRERGQYFMTSAFSKGEEVGYC